MSFELLFLGTGAADRMALEQDKDFENKDHRRCSCAIIDRKIMIDCGAHALNSLTVANIDLSSITDIVVTHLHADHFNIEAINTIYECNPNLNVWVSENAVVNSSCKAKINNMKYFEEYDISGFKFTGVSANHQAFPQHLCIEKDGKKLFYSLDGAWMLNDTANFLKNKVFDAVVLDATVGDYVGDYRLGEHNSIPMIRLMIPSMKTLNIVDDNTSIYLSHIACCLHKSYEETCEITKNDNFIIAYDGFAINI